MSPPMKVKEAFVAYQRGDVQAARVLLWEALRDNPDDLDALLGLIKVTAHSGRPQEILPLLDRALKGLVLAEDPSRISALLGAVEGATGFDGLTPPVAVQAAQLVDHLIDARVAERLYRCGLRDASALGAFARVRLAEILFTRRERYDEARTFVTEAAGMPGIPASLLARAQRMAGELERFVMELPAEDPAGGEAIELSNDLEAFVSSMPASGALAAAAAALPAEDTSPSAQGLEVGASPALAAAPGEKLRAAPSAQDQAAMRRVLAERREKARQRRRFRIVAGAGALVVLLLLAGGFAFLRWRAGWTCKPYTGSNLLGEKVEGCIGSNGKLRGLVSLSSPDGTKKSECLYVEGKRHGPFTGFDAQGRVRESGRYEQDRRHGVWTTFDEAGKERSHRSYVADRLEGPYVAVRADGSREREGAYRGGKREGPWTAYDARGEVVAEEVWEADRLISSALTVRASDAPAPAEDAPAAEGEEARILRFAGRPLVWWARRLAELKRAEDAAGPRLFGLALQRARATGLEVTVEGESVRVSPSREFLARCEEEEVR